MPIHFRENQFNGVNAHLHSILQRNGGGWEMFHAAHITHLTDQIDALLPENYYVLNEKSLQLGFIDVDSVERRLTRTRPDIAIYGEASNSGATPGMSAVPTATLPLVKWMIEDDPLDSAVIQRIEPNGETIPVTRIELLSPANKPGGSHFRQYLEKRQDTLESGINLVELDYLNETRPVVSQLPSYPDKEVGAYPYSILVSNPHPSFAEGRTAVYGFGTDDTIPAVEIPLTDDDTIVIDFNLAYQRTFASNRYYGTILVDYEQLPVNFAAYTEADQHRVRERMAFVQAKT